MVKCWSRDAPDLSDGRWVGRHRGEDGRRERRPSLRPATPSGATPRRGPGADHRPGAAIRRDRGHAAPTRPSRDHARRRSHRRRRHLRSGRAARGRPRVLGRGDPLRPDPVAPGRPRLQGHRRGHRGPRGHPRPPHRSAEHGQLRGAARAGARPPRGGAGRPGRALDGWSPRRRAGRQRAPPGHRGDPPRRHRGRHVGSHGQRVPGVPAPARRHGDHACGWTP